MSFKEQIAADLTALMAADEVSEDVVYTSGDVSQSIKCVFNIEGDTSLDWTEGNSIQATVSIAKSALSSVVPKPHDTITDSSGRLWYVNQLASEDLVSWRISVFTGVRVK